MTLTLPPPPKSYYPHVWIIVVLLTVALHNVQIQLDHNYITNLNISILLSMLFTDICLVDRMCCGLYRKYLLKLNIV